MTERDIALITAGVIGAMCFLTGLAMIYEPAAVIVLGISVVGVCLGVAYLRGSRAT